MASGSSAWFDEHRLLGVIGAIAAAVVAVISILDLDEVGARDIVFIAAAVGSYLVYGAVSRCPAWAPFAVACVSVTVLNLPELRTEGSMFFVVLGLAHLALNEQRRLVVLGCGLVAVAVPAIVAVSGDRDWSWQYWMMGFGFGWGVGELGYRGRPRRRRGDDPLAPHAIAGAASRWRNESARETRKAGTKARARLLTQQHAPVGDFVTERPRDPLHDMRP